MNNKQNLHTHTTYVDGKDTPEELILKAIEKSFTSIGFSEHSYLQYSKYPHQLTPKDMLCYKEEIRQLKQKYLGMIDVFCGLEYDFYSDLELDGFDYLIGSVHYLDCGETVATFDSGLKETLAYIKSFFGDDPRAFF